MQIASFLASSSKQAMIDLRASLGDDAIILGAKTLENGQVSITGAAAQEKFDLADILDPLDEPRSYDWLISLAEFHGWPFEFHGQAEQILKNIKLADPEFVLKMLIETYVSFEEIRLKDNRPLLLSGPPGCGKTVAIVKIAASCVLAGDSIDVITLDVDRAGSFNRLANLLVPLGLKPIPAPEPTELPKIVGSCRSDVVIIDSAGTNPFDSSDMGRMSALLNLSEAELLPVLPAGQGAAESAEIARNYLAMGAKSMVVTKLDAARRLGGILAAAEVGLSLTKAGIGPTIGDGLSTLTPDGIARLLLCRYRRSIGEGKAP